MCKLLDFIRAKLVGGPGGLPKVGRRTVDDLRAYFVETWASGQPMTVHDIIEFRRVDKGGWEASESVLMDNGNVLQTFDFLDDKNNGDGGQVVEIAADGFARSIRTRDGGKSHMQYFVGRNNGGTGWIFAGHDAPTGKWRELVALLAGSNWSEDKPPLGKALTRYRRETAVFPWPTVARYERTLDCIISEHFDGETVAASHAMERSYFAKGFGLVRWEAWTRTPPSTDTTNAMVRRYEHVDYSEPPTPAWYLGDVRTYTHVVPCEPQAIKVMS